MRVRIFFIFVFVCCAFFNSQSQTHPYLYFNSSDIANIRSRATTNGIPAYKIWNDVILNSQIAFYRSGNNINGLATSIWDQENVYAFALAYIITQDESYLNDVRTVLWGGTNVPVGLLSQPPDVQWSGLNRVVALSMIYDLLCDSLTESEKTQIKTVIMIDVNNGLRSFVLDSWQSKHGSNQFALRASSLGIAALTLCGDPIYPAAANDIAFLRNRLLLDNDSFINRLYSEGAYHEGIGYGLWTFNKLLPFVQMLSRWDNIDYFHNQNIQSKLQNISTWLAYERFPFIPYYDSGFYFNILNDTWTMNTDAQTILSNLLVLAQLYQDGKATWLFNNTVGDISNLIPEMFAGNHWALTPSLFLSFILYNDVPAVDPGISLEKAKLFRERGLAYIRTSTNWADDNDVQFAIEEHQLINPTTGVYSAVHSQSDKNHFILNAYLINFIVDQGWGIARPEDHNYILIDNKGEAVNPYTSPGTPYGTVSSGELSLVSSPTYNFIHGNAKEAFDHLYENSSASPTGYIIRGISDPEWAPYVNPVLNADRYVTFIQPDLGLPPYVVISDDIQKDTSPHTYSWLFHAYASATSDLNPTTLEDSEILKIWSSAASTISLSSITWGYQYTTTAINPYFHIVLIPIKISSPPFTPTPIVAQQTASNGSCFKISWSGYDDYSMFRYANGNMSSSNFITDGKLTQIRKTTSGQIASFSMGEGTSLTDNSTVLVQTYGVIATVMYSSSKVVIDGQGVQDFRIYAPNANSVTVNGIQTNFLKIGNYVESTMISHNRAWSSTVNVNSGVTLTISQGTTISFYSGASLVVNGKLIANGTSAQPITLSGGGIVLNGSGADGSIVSYANMSANSGTSIQAINAHNITIQYFNCLDNGSITISNSTGTVQNCRLSNPDCSGNRIVVNNGSTINCYYNTLWDGDIIGDETGIIYSNGSSGNIGRNDIVFLDVGIDIFNYSSPYFHNPTTGKNNRVTNCEVGIRINNNSNPVIGYNGTYCYGANSIHDNFGSDIVLNNGSGSPCILNALGTYWNNGNPANAHFYIHSGSSIDVGLALTVDPWANIPLPSVQSTIQNPASTSGTTMRKLVQSKSANEKISETQILDGVNSTSANQLIKGIELQSQNKVDQAKDFFISYLCEHPDNQQAYGYLYNCYNNETAVDITKYFESFPGAANKEYKIFLGYLYLKQGNTEAAKVVNNKIISENINTPLAMRAKLNNFYITLYNENDSKTAESILKEVLQKKELLNEAELSIAQNALQTYVNPKTGEISNISSEQSIAEQIPEKFGLLQNYPNPFNPATVIKYQLPAFSSVKLSVYDILGREVATLADGIKEAGYYTVTFDGSRLASGIYFTRLIAQPQNGNNTFIQVKKMMLMK